MNSCDIKLYTCTNDIGHKFGMINVSVELSVEQSKNREFVQKVQGMLGKIFTGFPPYQCQLGADRASIVGQMCNPDLQSPMGGKQEIKDKLINTAAENGISFNFMPSKQYDDFVAQAKDIQILAQRLTGLKDVTFSLSYNLPDDRFETKEPYLRVEFKNQDAENVRSLMTGLNIDVVHDHIVYNGKRLPILFVKKG